MAGGGNTMVTVALLVRIEAKPCQEKALPGKSPARKGSMHVCGGGRSIRMQDRIRIQRIRI
jgi:hypothetical protein